MKIVNKNAAVSGAAAESGDMEAINAFAKKELKPEEVFVFSVILCDNDIDRDFERFSDKTLEQLAGLFVGKTGISDHEWKSGGQVARIFRAEVVSDPERETATGETYACLKAGAYILRTEANAQLIADIEGGIKKETSVGCAVAESLCSICGKPIGSPECGHIKGREYGGKLCYASLENATDAYEWSFVAVPAQRNAGVTKGFDAAKGLAGLVQSEEGRGFSKELETLQKEAALGKKYLALLRGEVKRLGLLCDRDLGASLEKTVDAMDEPSLTAMRAALEKKAAEKLPIVTQLPGKDATTRFDGGEYLI